MGFRKDFLWGGATAANQYEGYPLEKNGALATCDVMTNGSHTVRRQVTWKKEDGNLFYADVQMLGYYPNYILADYKRKGLVIPAKEGDLEIISKYTCDFLSFSCYCSGVVTTHTENTSKGDGNGASSYNVANSYLKTNAWGWPIDPQCLRIVLNVLNNRYHCPLWCVENGIGWQDKIENDTIHDDYRIEYMRANIQSMKDAVEFDGIFILGEY